MKTLHCLSLLGALMLPGFAAHAQEQTPPAPAAAHPAVRLTGRVITWDGRPIAGAALRYELSKDHVTAELLRAPHATTAADGTFELVQQPPPRNATSAPQLFVAAKGMAAITKWITWTRKGGTPTVHNDLVMVLDEDGDEIWVPLDHPLAVGKAQQEPEYEPETKLGDLVLAEGARLTGRVRDEHGKPLAGVRVIAQDLLEQGNALRGGRAFGFYATAVSDEGGIFVVPHTLPFGATLQFQLDGYQRERLDPVDTASNLDVTLSSGGWIAGRTVDHEGRAVADASVSVAYELAGGITNSPAVKSAVDGTFRINLDRPGRWRATASRKVGDHHEQARSDVLQGPKEQLELVFKEPAKDEQPKRIPIRVVAKASGKPVAAFRAFTVWEEYANQNSNYLEYRLRNAQQAAKLGKDGTAEVPGPGKHSPSVGVLRVIAPGFAPFTKKELEWKEPEAGKAPEPVVAELEPEATVRGWLVDENSGARVAGAKVWAQRRQDPNQGTYNDGSGPPTDAVTTGEDGTFLLTGLGEGGWEILVRDPKRPRAPAKDVDLAAGEQKADFVIQVASGAAVEGRLTGAPLGNGTKVFLSRLPKQSFGDSQNYYSYYSYNQQQVGNDAVEVKPDGSFKLEGIALENHLLVMRQPSPPRHGGDLYLPLEPFRVRAQGIQREFDCSADRPGTIRGKIEFPHAVLPYERIAVVAQLINDDNNNRVYYSNPHYPGPRAFAGPTGEFALRVGPGNYQLLVVDLGTSLLLHTETKKVEVATGANVERSLQIPLASIEVELKPAADVKAMAEVDRLEIRIVPKAGKGNHRFGGNDNYDTGAGLRWPRGVQKLQLVLPLGEASFFCRSQTVNLRVDDNRWENAPLGRAEMEIDVGGNAKSSCTIEVGAVPEIPDPDKKAAEEGEVSADGAANGKD